MARPIKDNADYFTHDADMRDDPKIKALRRKFKAEGYGIWNMLLEAITDSDNFRLKIDLEIMAGDFEMTFPFTILVLRFRMNKPKESPSYFVPFSLQAILDRHGVIRGIFFYG